MKHLLFFTILIFTLCSCSSISKVETRQVTLHTQEVRRIIFQGDTISSSSNEIKINPYLSKTGFEFLCLTDSHFTTIQVKAHVTLASNFRVITNQVFGPKTGGKIRKTYSYPSHIYLDPDPNKANFYTYQPWANRNGRVDLSIGLPYMNQFNLRPITKQRTANFGFFGLQIGLDLYYKDDRFVNLSFGRVSDYFIPIPIRLNPEVPWEEMSSTFFGFTDNLRIRNWKIGYGLSFARNKWATGYNENLNPSPEWPEPETIEYLALGLFFPVYYQFNPGFHLGLIYRPSIYQFSTGDNYVYEYVLSLDFNWRFSLKR